MKTYSYAYDNDQRGQFGKKNTFQMTKKGISYSTEIKNLIATKQHYAVRNKD